MISSLKKREHPRAGAMRLSTAGKLLGSLVIALACLLPSSLAHAAALPDGRGLELVSPPVKGGGGANVLAVRDDGNRVIFGGDGFYGDALFYRPTYMRFSAGRSASGWDSQSLVQPIQDANGKALDYTPDLTHSIVQAQGWIDQSFGRTRMELVGPGGVATPLSPVLSPAAGGSVQGSNGFSYAGASVDNQHMLLTGDSSGALDTGSLPPLPSTSALGSAAAYLYEIVDSGPDATIRVVNRDNDDSVIGGGCGAQPGGGSGNATGYHVISTDGKTIYFQARVSSTGAFAAPGASCSSTTFKLRVYARRADAPAGSKTVAVSQSQCTRVSPACSTTFADDLYEGASADGSRVLFSTTRQLTNSDTDTTNDLYLYDESPPAGQPKLVQVSAGEASPSHPVVGAGAVYQGVVRRSEDGSRIYFVATGVLTATPNALGQSASGTTPKLYVYERDAGHPTGRTAFVATLSPSDSTLWQRVISPTVANRSQAVPALGPAADGHVLVFQSKAAITSDDADATDDVYRYDDGTGAIVRISVGGPGETAGNGPYSASIIGQFGQVDYASSAVYAAYAREVSEDGRIVVFTTNEALVAGDRNDAPDVYKWQGGVVSLISVGTGARGTDKASFGSVMTPSGDDIFFNTSSSLLPQDTDQSMDVYDARVGGGFAAPEDPSAPCVATDDACQAPPGAPPADRAPESNGAAPAPAALAAPSFAVRAVSAADLRSLARTGRLRLQVAVSEAGGIRSSVSALVGKRMQRIASATASPRSAGKARLTLKMSKAARRELKGRRSMAITITTAFSKAPTSVKRTYRVSNPDKKHVVKAVKRASKAHRGRSVVPSRATTHR